MMASGMGLRLLGGAGATAAAPSGGPGIGESDFLALLGGAAASGRQGTKPLDAAADHDPSSDPALAAAVAALYPGQVLAVAGEGADADGSPLDGAAGEGDVALLQDSAVGIGDSAEADAALDTFTDEALAAPSDSTDALQDVMQQLTHELGAARESGARSMPADLRGPSLGDALSAVNTLSGVTQAGAPATAQAPAMDQLLRNPVGTPRWADEMSSRLVMMATRGQQEGSLTLTPENLGPMEVRISMSQNTAHVWFGAQSAETRAALNEALPRLREMFAEAGLALGQTGVSHEAPRRGSAELPSSLQPEGEGSGPAPAVQTPVQRAVAGLLDLYA